MPLPGRLPRARELIKFTVHRGMPELKSMRSVWTSKLWNLMRWLLLQRKKELT